MTTYPGVYLRERSIGAGSVTPVSTATAAFVGYTRRGPLHAPVRIGSLADYEQHFGGLSRHDAVGHAARQFFANGGSAAVIVRVIKEDSADEASLTLFGHEYDRRSESDTENNVEEAPGDDDRHHGRAVLEIFAKEPGHWANGLRVWIDHATRDPEETFNLHVFGTGGHGRETYQNLSMDPDHPRFACTVINAASRWIRVDAVGRHRPDPSGTVSEEFGRDLGDLDVDVTVRIGDEEREFRLHHPHHDGPPPRHLPELAALLERKLRAQPDRPGSTAFAGARVRAFGRRLQTVAGSLDERDEVHFRGEHCRHLGLEAFANPPVFALAGGDDGDPPQAGDLIGEETARTGLHALSDAESINLLNLPDLADWESLEDAATVLAAADRICREQRIFLIIDAPAAWTGVDAARHGIERLAAVRSDHAALYFPHLIVSDPVTGTTCPVPPGGAVAGVIARTDLERGVWKAPAGAATRLAGVRALTVPLTDRDNGLLYPLAVNCLRTFPGTGPVVWGARTLDSGDTGDEWGYVPVRRLALHVAESLHRSLRWVVFEPNGEQLWQAIRLEAGSYLDVLFRRGAFAGRTPREAFFVRCDASTTTEADIDGGVVNVVVGFAPVEPAEFVIVNIQQLAGQPEHL